MFHSATTRFLAITMITLKTVAPAEKSAESVEHSYAAVAASRENMNRAAGLAAFLQ